MKHAIMKRFSDAKAIAWFKTGGRIYFRKDAERKLFFYLTIAMLIAGILAKLDII